MSRKKLTYKDFINYFSNNLQNKDKHDFEKEMMRDAFEEEAFDGLSKLSAEDLEKDLNELRTNISDNIKKTRRIIPVWFRYAASIIILIGIGFTIVFLNSRYWNESMLKEQVAKEMEMVDSIMVETEKVIQKSTQEQDTIEIKPEELIADNKKQNSKKSAKIEKGIVEDKIEDSDAFISEADEEIEFDDAMDMIEFEEEEEVVEDEIIKIEGSTPVKAIAVEQEKKEADFAAGVSEQDVEKALHGKLAGVQVRGKSSTPQSAKKSNKEIEAANQVTIVKGRIVSSDDDLSIPGVSVTLKDNPQFGTTTNMDGEFQLNLPVADEDLKTLIASFVGMKSIEIEIEEDTNLLVYMEPDVLEMDEVVVVGYGVSNENKGLESVRISAKPPTSNTRNKFKKQILDALDYTKFSEYPGNYRIKVTFTVGEDGSLYNFIFSNSPNETFSNEIKGVIKELGKWHPATEDERNITSTVKLTLKFEVIK